MDRKAAGVCGIIAILGILAALAGFAAEVTKLKPSEVHFQMEHSSSSSCVYPRRRSLSIGLGILGAILTMINQIVICIFVGGHRTRGSTPTPAAAVFTFILSSIAALTGIILSALSYDHKRQEKDGYDTLTCYGTRPGMFGAGAVCSLLAALFGIVGYIFVSSAAKLTTSQVELQLPAAVSNVDLETQQ